MSSPKLLLLDMDGTLLTKNPHGTSSSHKLEIFSSVIMDIFGIGDARYEKVLAGDLAGLTDVLILRRMLHRIGVPVGNVEARLQLLIDTLCDRVSDVIDSGVKSDYYMLLPGVVEMLEELRSAGHSMAICTGNLECVAHMKTGFTGLDTINFGPGAFGTDADERWRIIETAIARNPGFDKNDIIYFGDTPRDIAAAEKAGLRCVAVCYTGEFTPEELSGAWRVVTDWHHVTL